MKVRARAARTGVYQYAGHEVDPENKHGLRDQATVNVLRDADAVFDRASLASFVGKPITDDHPSVAVNASNWRDHGRGVIMGAVQDGEYVSFDLAFHDGPTIAKIDSGKVELSNGYSASLAFGDFKGPNGEDCPVRQTAIVGNHIALVDKGRAGSECAIRDAAQCASLPSTILDTLKTEKPVSRTLTIDGLPVNVADADAATATINRLVEQRDAAAARVTTLDATVATLTTEKATLDAKVVTLEQAVKDAKPTPAQLRDAGKALMLTAGKAKALGVTVTDAMDETAIVKAVVDAKVKAELREGWNDGQYAASFAVLADGVKVADTAIHPINAPVIVKDAGTEYMADRAKRHRDLSSAWKTPFNIAEAANA